MKKRSRSKKSKKSFWDNFFPLSKRWDFVLVLLFLFGRLILNLELETLSIFFACSYLILISLMFLHKKSFVVATIMFLFIDSIIGTFLFTLKGNLNYEYFWTVFVNLIIVFFLVFDMRKNFRKK